MKKQIITKEEIEEVKNRLPKRCAYSTIAEMLGGKYKPDTIKRMFIQNRTMSPLVLDAAKKLIDFIAPEGSHGENEAEK